MAFQSWSGPGACDLEDARAGSPSSPSPVNRDYAVGVQGRTAARPLQSEEPGSPSRACAPDMRSIVARN